LSGLLIVSDSPALHSGQARVVRELASRFHRDDSRVIVAGWFHDLAPASSEATPYRVVPTDKHRQESLAPILAAVKPETVLAIGDPWEFRWLARTRADSGAFRLVGHLNIEAEPIPLDQESVLDAFDVLTTTSEWGARVVGRAGVTAIHYGVDRGVFFPQDKPEEAFGRQLRKTFVVLLNGQNIQRKNFAAALAGFAAFARGKGDVFCYANTERTPAPTHAAGSDLASLVIQLGIESLVAFNPGNHGPHVSVSDRHVAAYYGLADALLMPSMSEGFGLTLLEAMATKTVPIGTASFSVPELLEDGRGVLIPVAGYVRSNRETNYAVVSESGVADALNLVYDQWRDGALGPYHDAGLAFAASRSWRRTYDELVGAMAAPVRRRAATGHSIDAHLRIRAGRAVAAHPGSIGVMKIGGLGDMLQTTTVVRAAAQKYKVPVVVLANGHAEIFTAMPEVAGVVLVRDDMAQAEAVRSVADQFPVFLDVRYVSRVYGTPPTEFAVKHAWHYDH
jgi:glycosyltransferase involved in cell wall biosynthesis